jgi:hypothetical protein
VSDTSCCRNKFKITSNSTVVCAHFKKICIWAFTIVICHFRIIKFVISFQKWCREGLVSWLLGPVGKLFLARDKKVAPPCSTLSRVTETFLMPMWHLFDSSEEIRAHCFHSPAPRPLIPPSRWKCVPLKCSLVCAKRRKAAGSKVETVWRMAKTFQAETVSSVTLWHLRCRRGLRLGEGPLRLWASQP